MEPSARLSSVTSETRSEEASAALEAAAAAAGSSEAAARPLTDALLDRLPLLARPALAAPFARLVAALARQRPCRERLTLPALVAPLAAALAAAETPQALVQPCRALGNLCFENGPARAALLGTDGAAAVAAAVRRAAEAGPDGARAREVASGLVLNFISDHPPAVEWAVESGVANQLIAAACRDVTEAPLVRHALLVAGLVCDSPRRESLLESRLAPLLAACLVPDQEPSVLEEALDTACAWCRHDSARLPLAQAGVADSLCRLLSAAAPPAEARSLLVELLSGDQAMAAVYRRGDGTVYRAVRDWLAAAGRPDADDERTACACDALGNFATNDDHTLAMVRDGVHRDLLTPLTSDSARQQMAALSLLRNLTLPPQNKKVLLDAGFLDVLLGLAVVEQPALFKFYATLRLLVSDSSAACGQLAKHPGFLRQLSAAALGEGPYGVQHEARRLLARIVRTARCEEVSRLVVEADGHDGLVRLLQSTNAVMANEALLALCLTVPHTDPQQILSSGCVSALSQVMKNDAFPEQVKENATALLRLLRSKDDPALLERLSEVPEPDLAGSGDR